MYCGRAPTGEGGRSGAFLGKFEANKRALSRLVWLSALKLNQWLIAAQQASECRPRGMAGYGPHSRALQESPKPPEIGHGSAASVRDHGRSSPCPHFVIRTGVRAELRRPDDFMMVTHLAVRLEFQSAVPDR